MSEEISKGPITDAIKAKIAKIIENPEQFIAFVKMLIALIPKKQDTVFSAAETDPAIVELVEMCQSAQD